MPDHQSSQVQSAWSAPSSDGIEHPAKPTAARRSRPRWSVIVDPPADCCAARRCSRGVGAPTARGLGRRSGCDGRGCEAAAFSHAARRVPVASVRPACL